MIDTFLQQFSSLVINHKQSKVNNVTSWCDRPNLSIEQLDKITEILIEDITTHKNESIIIALKDDVRISFLSDPYSLNITMEAPDDIFLNYIKNKQISTISHTEYSDIITIKFYNSYSRIELIANCAKSHVNWFTSPGNFVYDRHITFLNMDFISTTQYILNFSDGVSFAFKQNLSPNYDCWITFKIIQDNKEEVFSDLYHKLYLFSNTDQLILDIINNISLMTYLLL